MGRKLLIGGMVLFAVLQMFFIYKRVHNYPFMIYDMYSRPASVAQPSRQYLVIANGDTLATHRLPVYAEGKLLNSLAIYDHYLEYGEDYWAPALKDRGQRMGNYFHNKSHRLRNDPAEVEEYPRWLVDFVQRQLLEEPLQTLTIQRIAVDARSLEILRHEPILEWKR